MARTSLPATNLTLNGALLTFKTDGTAMTAIDATNGHTISVTTNTIPVSYPPERLIILAINTTAATKTFTIRGATSDGGASKLGAGANTDWYANVPGFEGSKGDVTSGNMIASTGIGIFGPFEVARFLQPDGTISIDFAASTTGFVAALFLTRAVG